MDLEILLLLANLQLFRLSLFLFTGSSQKYRGSNILSDYLSFFILYNSFFHPIFSAITFKPGTRYAVANTFSCIFNLPIELSMQRHTFRKALPWRCHACPALSDRSHTDHTPEITWSRERSLASSSTVSLFSATSVLTFTVWDSRRPAKAETTSLHWGHLFAPGHFSLSFLPPSQSILRGWSRSSFHVLSENTIIFQEWISVWHKVYVCVYSSVECGSLRVIIVSFFFIIVP